MKAGMRRACRHCGAQLIYARERDVPATLAGWVDAAPMSVFAPLTRAPPDGPVWEHHPRLGWVCLDFPRRRGYPLHLHHNCKQKTDARQIERKRQ